MAQPAKPPLAILLMGPTASGKTQLAIDLCQHLPCDIVSVDSAQVYRGMDIGTAKPSAEELRLAPHRLIDICDPTEAYSAARFCQDARRELDAIAAAGRIPLLVGGTMLYYRALQQGLANLPEADPGVRATLAQQAATLGWDALHRELKAVDPVAASRIHPNDPQRIQRALEVYQLTGTPMSELQQRGRVDGLDFTLVKLARTTRDRHLLHTRIEQRFQQMLEQGLVEEVRGLRQAWDLVPDMPSMRSVGYRQVLKYLLGEWDRKTMAEKGVVATRQLAKRQLTWLRAEEALHWLDESPAAALDQALNLIAAASS